MVVRMVVWMVERMVLKESGNGCGKDGIEDGGKYSGNDYGSDGNEDGGKYSGIYTYYQSYHHLSNWCQRGELI